ncbi:MAG: hypothetical protein WA294_09260 [Acidobacteriaceae bacterium]
MGVLVHHPFSPASHCRTWGVTRFIRNQLWPVRPNDPWSFAGAMVVVILTGVLACLVPARRATEVDPLAALRRE